MVKIGPASRGEFNVSVFYVTFHVFLVIILVMYLTVTSINFTTTIFRSENEDMITHYIASQSID